MFEFDAAQAAQADQQGGFITRSGAYIGFFSNAWEHKNPVGQTESLGLTFVSECGKTKDIYLCYAKVGVDKSENWIKNNTALIMSLMGLLSLTRLEESGGTMQVKDGNGNKVDRRVKIFKGLMTKRIGVVFDEQEDKKGYTDKNGNKQFGVNVNAIRFFDAETRQLYSEKKENTEATALDKVIAGLSHIERNKPAQATQTSSASFTAPPANNDLDFDDDIPFNV